MNRRRARRIAVPLIAVSIAIAMLIPAATAFAYRPAAHGVLKACRVATKSEASAALGGKITKVSGSQVAQFSSCSFQTHNFQQMLTFQIATSKSLTQFFRRATSAASAFSKAKKGFPSKIHIVQGIGQQAFWGKAYGLPELWVLKGDVVFSIASMKSSVTKMEAMAKSVEHGL